MPATTTVNVGGRLFVVPTRPDGTVTGSSIKRETGIGRSESLFTVTPESHHRMIGDDEAVHLGDGAVVDSILPHTAAGRDMRRVNTELRLLQEAYGADNVYWPSDYSYVEVRDFRLPPLWNQEVSDIVVLLPNLYGRKQPIRDCFLEPELKRWDGAKYRPINHYFDGQFTPYGFDAWREKGWSYLCLHMEEWRDQDTVFSYFKNVYTFLDNPDYPWKS